MQPSWGGHTRWEATDGTLGAGAQRCKCSEGAAGKALPCVHSVQGVSQAGSRADLGDVGGGGGGGHKVLFPERVQTPRRWLTTSQATF